MAHWFQRNPLKATALVKFELPSAKGTEAKEICVALRSRREKLLQMLGDANLETGIVEEAARQYLAFLHGFVYAGPESSSPDSKLRHAVKFSWSNTLSQLGVDNQVNTQQDCFFELLSIVFNIAIWYTKHAARLAGQQNVTDLDAKEVFKNMKVAAGMFSWVKENVDKLLDRNLPIFADFDEHVISAYLYQTLAEAQEVTMAHALEQKHNNGLIAQLASEVSRLYQIAEHGLSSTNDKRFLRWAKYFEFKRECYMAYAFCYHGYKKLDEEEAGYALGCMRECGKHYDKAEDAGKEYSRISQSGVPNVPNSIARPVEHPFFRRLRPELVRVYDKIKRENDIIFHQKVPDTIPELDIKAEYGIVKPEPFTLPTRHELWTEKALAAFDLSADLQKPPKKDDSKVKIEPTNEKPYDKQATDVQNTNSGCTIS